MKVYALGKGQDRVGLAGRQADKARGFGKVFGQLEQSGGAASYGAPVSEREDGQEADTGSDSQDQGSGGEHPQSNNLQTDWAELNEINSAFAVLARGSGAPGPIPTFVTEQSGARVADYTMCPHVSLLSGRASGTLGRTDHRDAVDLPEGLTWAAPPDGSET